MGLGKRVRELREQMNSSQAQLAATADVSQGYLCQVEREEVKNPSAAILLRIASALFVDPRELLEAAGYTPCRSDPTVGYGIDLGLLEFLATKMSRRQQKNLTELLQGEWKGLVEPAQPVHTNQLRDIGLIDFNALTREVLAVLQSYNQPFSPVGLTARLVRALSIVPEPQRYLVKRAVDRLKREGRIVKDPRSGAGQRTLWKVPEGSA